MYDTGSATVELYAIVAVRQWNCIRQWQYDSITAYDGCSTAVKLQTTVTVELAKDSAHSAHDVASTSVGGTVEV